MYNYVWIRGHNSPIDFKEVTHVAFGGICSHLVEYEIGFITFLGFSDGMFWSQLSLGELQCFWMDVANNFVVCLRQTEVYAMSCLVFWIWSTFDG